MASDGEISRVCFRDVAWFAKDFCMTSVSLNSLL